MTLPNIKYPNFLECDDKNIFLNAPKTILAGVDFGGVSTDENLHIKVSGNDYLVRILFIYWAGKSTLYIKPL